MGSHCKLTVFIKIDDHHKEELFQLRGIGNETIANLIQLIREYVQKGDKREKIVLRGKFRKLPETQKLRTVQQSYGFIVADYEKIPRRRKLKRQKKK